MEIEMTKLIERFQKYIHFETQSDDAQTGCPSTPGQLLFARYLVEELKNIGLQKVRMDEHGYVMAELPANGCEHAPAVGFISHMDTSPDMAAGPMKERIVRAYDGGDIVLDAADKIVLSPADFPELRDYTGQDLMVTDGHTLLGADDKAGICEIVSAMEYLIAHPEIQHGKLCVAFTPDEEIGRSADLFDVGDFGADFAYTLDGGAIGGLEYENFNAANVKVVIYGRGGHTGSAKGKMINAVTIAAEWQQLLPAGESPEYTEGYEGFYHVHKIAGDVEQVEMTMLIRDHDRVKFEKRKAFLQSMAELLNVKYGAGTVAVDAKDRYFNMREKIEPVMYVVEMAEQAMRAAGVEPVCQPIRGGTDGARLSFMGLPCPNLFTGGHNYHGRFEYLSLQSMQKAAEVVVHIAEEAGKR